METKNRYSYPQLAVVRSAKAPGQYSIGTGGQYSFGRNTTVVKTGVNVVSAAVDAVLPSKDKK